jgi:hypothetical protein
LVILVQTGHIERSGILGVTLVHHNIDLCMLFICGCLVDEHDMIISSFSVLFASNGRVKKRREKLMHTDTDPNNWVRRWRRWRRWRRKSKSK